MGVEQGGDYFTDYGDPGSYDYGGSVAMESNGGGGGSYDFGDADFYYGYGTDQPVLPDNVSPSGEAIAWGDIGAGGDFTYGYGTDYGASLPPDYAPSGSDLFGAFFDYYSAQGYDDYTAMQMAATDAAGGSILTETYEPGITQLPNLPEQYFALPPPPYDYLPYTPDFEQYYPLPPPPLPPSPATQQPNLPPYCPAGQYHPYPIGHPQQNLCVAFPQATTQAPKPPSATSGAPTPAPKPPAAKPPAAKPPTQQACPQGYYRDTATGQCKPIPRCTTPGTVFDSRTGRCVPSGQASAPGCPPGEWFNPQTRRCEPTPACPTPGTVFDVNTAQCVLPNQLTSGEDIFGGLKDVPWWLWIAGLGVFLLLGGSEDRRTTTVRYRRAT